MSGYESALIAVAWTNSTSYPPFLPCNSSSGTDTHWNGIDHIEIHRVDGTAGDATCSDPGSPTSPSASADKVAVLDANKASWVDATHRADKDFAYTVFACENASCSSWWGDGSGSDEGINSAAANDEFDYACTEAEAWVLTSITGESVVDVNVVDDYRANAPEVLFFPESWTYEDYFEVLWSISDDQSDTGYSQIWSERYGSTGWPSGGFNSSGGWSSTSSATLIATGADSDSEDDYGIDHPNVMLTTNAAGDRRMVLMAPSQHDSSAYHDKIVQVTSSDDTADDFDLDCEVTTPGVCDKEIISDSVGTVAVVANGTSGCLDDARHARVYTDYMDGTAEVLENGGAPRLLHMATGSTSGSCSCASGSAPDDIGQSTGSFSGGVWIWSLAVYASCPVIQVTDAHDVAVIPLPDGDFKAYYRSGDDLVLSYWNSSDNVFEDEMVVEVKWDDGSGGASATGPSSECIANVAGLVYKSGDTPPVYHEGLFFKLQDSIGCGATGLNDDVADPPGSSQTTNDAAIVSAEHLN